MGMIRPWGIKPLMGNGIVRCLPRSRALGAGTGEGSPHHPYLDGSGWCA